jgi:hypothetical protein
MEPDSRAEVLETELPLDLIEPLFTQLEATAQIQEIRVQSRRERLSGAQAYDRLTALRCDLVQGALNGLQIRYRHDGSEWIDTFLRRPGISVRLVRTRLASRG